MGKGKKKKNKQANEDKNTEPCNKLGKGNKKNKRSNGDPNPKSEIDELQKRIAKSKEAPTIQMSQFELTRRQHAALDRLVKNQE